MKICYVENVDFGFYHFRPALVKTLIEHGHEIHLICPTGKDTSTLISWGIRHHHVDLEPNSINVAKDRKFVSQSKKILLDIRPDVVHTYSIKPNIYIPKIAKKIGIKGIICSVIGLGSMFTLETLLIKKIFRPVIINMYKESFRFADKVIFINRDDKNLFLEKGILSPNKAELIISEGLDLRYYSPNNIDKDVVEKLKEDLCISQDTPIILFASRMLWSKGVRELVEACRLLKKDGIKFRCFFAGKIDNKNRDSVPRSYIDNAVKEGLVEYLGMVREIKELLSISDIVVLPSYREGVPRILMEAAAMGKPLIATDVPGCREVVENEKNGLLVPPKDSESLNQAMNILMADETKRLEYGKNSLVMSKQKFDQKVINKMIIDTYKLFLIS